LCPKLFWSVNNLPKKESGPAYARGVCLGITDAVSHVPLASDLVDQVLRVTAGVSAKPIAPERHSIALTGRRHAPSHLTDEAFCQLYACSSAELRAARREIRAIKTLPCQLNHPLWKTVCDVDVPLGCTASLRPYMGATPMSERDPEPGFFTRACQILGGLACWYLSSRCDAILFHISPAIMAACAVAEIRERPAVAAYCVINASIRTALSLFWSDRETY
jgi:hypothetical protein